MKFNEYVQMLLENKSEDDQLLTANEAIQQLDLGKQLFSTDKGYTNFIFLKLQPSKIGRKTPTEEDMKTPYVMIHGIENGGTTEGSFTKDDFIKQFSKIKFVIKDKNNWWGYKRPVK